MNLRRLPPALLLFAALAAAGCSCAGPPKIDVGFHTGGRPSGDDDGLRTGSRKGEGSAAPDAKWRGKSLSLDEIRALEAAGRKALADPYFKAAMDAVARKDYAEAARQMNFAAGNLPGNDYVNRWTKRVRMYQQTDEAEKNEALQGAMKSLLGAPSTALERAAALAKSDNPFIRRKAHYARMNALEALGREDEAETERILWLETKLTIGEMDAECYAPAVDPAGK